MTSQGSPLSVLRRTIRGGSLGGVELALIGACGRGASEIVLLLERAGDQRFESWARRWVERAADEDANHLRALGRPPASIRDSAADRSGSS